MKEDCNRRRKRILQPAVIDSTKKRRSTPTQKRESGSFTCCSTLQAACRPDLCRRFYTQARSLSRAFHVLCSQGRPLSLYMQARNLTLVFLLVDSCPVTTAVPSFLVLRGSVGLRLKPTIHFHPRLNDSGMRSHHVHPNKKAELREEPARFLQIRALGASPNILQSQPFALQV